MVVANLDGKGTLHPHSPLDAQLQATLTLGTERKLSELLFAAPGRTVSPSAGLGVCVGTCSTT